MESYLSLDAAMGNVVIRIPNMTLGMNLGSHFGYTLYILGYRLGYFLGCHMRLCIGLAVGFIGYHLGYTRYIWGYPLAFHLGYYMRLCLVCKLVFSLTESTCFEVPLWNTILHILGYCVGYQPMYLWIPTHNIFNGFQVFL